MRMLTVLLLATLSTSGQAADTADLIKQCEVLASSPVDIGRPDGVDGVPFDDIKPDDATAACRTALAVAPGNVRMMANLGRALENKHKDEAALYYRKAADLGSILAANNLGALLEHGDGVPENDTEAVKLYRQAAAGGLVRAQLNLAGMLKRGEGVTKDEPAALAMFKMLAEAGDSTAMYNYGAMFEDGLGTAKDPAAAVTWYKKSADEGDGDGMNAYGGMLEGGSGIAKDEAAAVTWYRKGMDAGSSYATINLATMLFDGRGIAKDESAARRLLIEAIASDIMQVELIAGRGEIFFPPTRKAIKGILATLSVYHGPIDDAQFNPEAVAALKGLIKPK
jgi:TPR repeat protein